MNVAPEELTQSFDLKDDLSHFRWALATAKSYRDIGLELAAEGSTGHYRFECPFCASMQRRPANHWHHEETKGQFLFHGRE